MRPITERLSPAVKALIITLTVSYVLFVMVPALRERLMAWVFLGPGFWHGRLWQPLTAVFAQSQLMRWFFDVLGLWFVGATIERQLGRKRFLRIFFTAGVACNLAIAIVSRLLPSFGGLVRPDGAGFAVLALFVTFGRLFRGTQVQILGGLVLESFYATLLFVGLPFVMDLLQGDWPALAADVVAVTIGFALGGGGSREIWDLLKLKHPRRPYKVIDGGKSGKGRRGSTYLN
jgi:membrane associated rhomboid family serine protease